MASQDIHTVPSWQRHDTNGRDACDCGATVWKPCETCGDVVQPECWQCGGLGRVPLDAIGDDDTPAIVVHNVRDTP